MKGILPVFLCVYLSATAQTSDVPMKINHYLLDSFTNGQVKLRSGEVTNQKLNYNLITKEMIFEQGGKYLAIAYPEEVDSVFINDRKFVQVKNIFYEWLTGTKYPLFVEHTCTITESGVPIGIGASNLMASAAVNSLIRDGGAYRLQLPVELKVRQSQSFYIRKKWQYYKLKNERQMIDLLPEKRTIIEDWIKKEHTNFSQANEMILLAQQIQ